MFYVVVIGKLVDFGELWWCDGVVVIVVLVVENYFGCFWVGDVVVGFEVEGVLYVGIMWCDDGVIVLFGGWVLLVVGIGVDLFVVCVYVYEIFSLIWLLGGYFCSDIGLWVVEGKISV